MTENGRQYIRHNAPPVANFWLRACTGPSQNCMS